jgi:dipeptidase E
MRQIFAMGGGGFSMEPDNLLLDRYALSLSGKARPVVCFVPTASYDSESYIERFHTSIGSLGASTTVLRVSSGPIEDIEKTIAAADVIYVGGGKTLHLIKTWREWGVDVALKRAYDDGKVLCGISAGALCWFDEGLTDSIANKLTPMKCLGILPGSICVHYDGETERRPAYHHAVESGMAPGYGCDDGVGLHYVDGKLHKIVSSRPAGRAYAMSVKDGLAREAECLPEYLGGRPGMGTVIRAATSLDAAAARRAHHASILHFAPAHYAPDQVTAWAGPIEEEAALERFRAMTTNDKFWVLEIDGTVEGFACLRFPEELKPSAYLHAVYLTPKAAGNGLAKRLMAIAEDEAKARGYTGMKLHASRTAMGFYKKLGYTQAGPDLIHTVRGMPLECFPLAKSFTGP